MQYVQHLPWSLKAYGTLGGAEFHQLLLSDFLKLHYKKLTNFLQKLPRKIVDLKHGFSHLLDIFVAESKINTVTKDSIYLAVKARQTFPHLFCTVDKISQTSMF